MQTITMTRLLSIILFSALIISGCNKTSKTPSDPYFMSGEIGNSAVKFKFCESYFDKDTFIINGFNYTDVSTYTKGYPQIMLCLHNYQITTGTFAIDSVSGNVAWVVTGPNTTMLAVHGTITITAVPKDLDYNPPLAGYFNFTCADSTVISNGHFITDAWYGLL